MISAFDMFSIGIGPSSSHTVGPMRASRLFVNELHEKQLLKSVTDIKVELYGSLGQTGIGHGSGKAVVLGLAGYDPETADQFEIGVKNDFLDNRLRVNLAYYVLNREGAQFSSIITLPPGSIPGTTTYINNGGESESKGVEIEGQWFMNDNLRLIFNYGTIDVENSAFTLACELVDGCVTAVVGELDPSGTLRNLGGGSDSRQPEDCLLYTSPSPRDRG